VIQNEAFVSSLAKKLRPSLISDGNGSIIADMGACGLIVSISVTNDPSLKTELNNSPISDGGSYDNLKQTQFPNRIVVTPKYHMPFAPLLEPLSPAQAFFDTRRGVGHQWIYEIRGGISYFMMKNPPPIRFRLEVIQQ
jgi:hypothetical protein